MSRYTHTYAHTITIYYYIVMYLLAHHSYAGDYSVCFTHFYVNFKESLTDISTPCKFMPSIRDISDLS